MFTRPEHDLGLNLHVVAISMRLHIMPKINRFLSEIVYNLIYELGLWFMKSSQSRLFKIKSLNYLSMAQ